MLQNNLGNYFKILAIFFFLLFFCCENSNIIAENQNKKNKIPGVSGEQTVYVGSFNEYELTPKGSRPDHIQFDKWDNKIIWFSQAGAYRFAKFDSRTETFKTYLVDTNYRPDGLIVDHNGIIWIGEQRAGIITRFDPTDEQITHIRVPYSKGDPSVPTIDSDNNIWISDHDNSKFVFYDQVNESFESYNTITPKAWPVQIIEDQSGRMWYTEFFANKLGMIDKHTKTMGEVDVPTHKGGPAFLVLDSKNNIWFTEWNTNVLGCYKISTSEMIEYVIPTEELPGPAGICVDQNDIVYLGLRNANMIVRFDPKTNVFNTFKIPLEAGMKDSVIVEPDGSTVWFAEFEGNRIGKLKINIEMPGEYGTNSNAVKSVDVTAIKSPKVKAPIDKYKFKIDHHKSSKSKKHTVIIGVK